MSHSGGSCEPLIFSATSYVSFARQHPWATNKSYPELELGSCSYGVVAFICLIYWLMQKHQCVSRRLVVHE